MGVCGGVVGACWFRRTTASRCDTASASAVAGSGSRSSVMREMCAAPPCLMNATLLSELHVKLKNVRAE